VVFDEAQFSKFVHEEIHARAGSADYFRQSLLGNSWQFVVQLVLHPSITSEHEQRSGETLLGRIEELIDQSFLNPIFMIEYKFDKRV
jgi:hypothetical protein